MRESLGHVLLVDDDELTLEAFRRSLAREAKIEAVATASDAATLASKKKFAVVVTDLVMPGMNGLELIETLRVVSPDTVCIVISGRIDHPFPNGLPANVFKYLSKPCSIFELIDTLHSALAEYVLRCNAIAR